MLGRSTLFDIAGTRKTRAQWQITPLVTAGPD